LLGEVEHRVEKEPFVFGDPGERGRGHGGQSESDRRQTGKDLTSHAARRRSCSKVPAVESRARDWLALAAGVLSLGVVQAARAEASEGASTPQGGALEPVRTERIDSGKRLQLAFAPAFATFWGDFDGTTYFDNGASTFLAPDVTPGVGFAITLSVLWGGGKLGGPTGFCWGAEASYSQTFHGSSNSPDVMEKEGHRGPALHVVGSTGAARLQEIGSRFRVGLAPLPSWFFYTSLGVGFSFFSAERLRLEPQGTSYATTDSATYSGINYMLGLGANVHLARHFALDATLGYRWFLLNTVARSGVLNGSPSAGGITAWVGPSLVF
jgi:hypothetical protein